MLERFKSSKRDVLTAAGYVAGFAVLTSSVCYTIDEINSIPDHHTRLQTENAEVLHSGIDSDMGPKNELDLNPQDIGLLISVGAGAFLIGLHALDRGRE